MGGLKAAWLRGKQRRAARLRQREAMEQMEAMAERQHAVLETLSPHMQAAVMGALLLKSTQRGRDCNRELTR